MVFMIVTALSAIDDGSFSFSILMVVTWWWTSAVSQRHF